jgi:pyrimidine deaminase RibD-like protein/RNA-binding protein YhbY
LTYSASSLPRRVGQQQQRNYNQFKLSPNDEMYLTQAVEYAKNGKGHTFPNPAVGCVIVRDDTNEVLGAGFHPRAGYPHAEVFALLEAAGHVDSGVKAAQSVVDGTSDPIVEKLTHQYISTGGDDEGDDDHVHSSGPSSLFEGCFNRLKTSSTPPSATDGSLSITAYVTLEPCCHYGRTPPCAQSLVLAGVDRVVVGFRDPNPRVDGGGVQVLQDQGLTVDMATIPSSDDDDEGDDNKSSAAQACADLVENFVKRIIPKVDYDATDYSHVSGAMRRTLRSYAARKKADNALSQVNWSIKTHEASTEDEVNDLVLEAEWMERLDAVLWKEEVVNLRLNKAVGKKKLAKQLGERIAKELGAHVAQTVGHTALLYRPGIPPVLDLEEMTSSTQDVDN